MAHPIDDLRERAAALGLDVLSREFAQRMDEADELRAFREEFLIPATRASARVRQPGTRSLYFCGNSLGLQPRATRAYVIEELDKWAEYGVEGHMMTSRPWMFVDETVKEGSARLVGAKPLEVVVMNTLTVNLHLMMVAFYRPTATRFKILIEAKAFPSDWHAVQSQVSFHGFDPKDAIVAVASAGGDDESMSTDDVLRAIEEHGDTVALVLLPGVQYYTGQYLDIPTITAAARAKGCKVGWDLAHAVGNVPLKLHEWGVDFAAWCTYKYLNSGPGNIAGCFVHERHAHDSELPRFAGWWGHRKEDRFAMRPDFQPSPGAAGFQLSNPPVLTCAALRASLDMFDRATMPRLRAKSERLVAMLEALIDARLGPERVRIITPRDPARRGSQLSLCFALPKGAIIKTMHDRLQSEGIICDMRMPNVIRVAAAPLYNSFADVWELVDAILRISDQMALEEY